MSNNFSEGQRVRVLAFSNDDAIRNQIPVRSFRYRNSIGYVSDTGADSNIEVIITKIGERVNLPEWCLESAELRKS